MDKDLPTNSDGWEKELITKLLLSTATVNRKSLRLRRMTLGLRVMTFLMFAGFIGVSMFSPSNKDSFKEPHTAYIDINGEIAKGSQSDADHVIPALHKAFKNEHSKAVIIRINSPGGSPVQSHQIYKEIRRLKTEYDKKAYAVIDDMGASGGYFIAAGTDEIYADPASIVGSIGVISASFGFSDLMEKVGVERRVLVSGQNKSMLDPYSPVSEDAEKQWKTILQSTHNIFISSVKEGRGDRLDEGNELLFSGFVWGGTQAKEIGLIDDFGSLTSVAADIVGEAKTVDYTPKKDFFSSLSQRVSVYLNTVSIR